MLLKTDVPAITTDEKRVMKKYLCILATTGIIQVIGFTGCFIIDRSNLSGNNLAFHWLLISLVGSNILGIVLPLIVFRTIKSRLFGIFLLPTNYTILLLFGVVVLFGYWLVNGLNSLPAGFG